MRADDWSIVDPSARGRDSVRISSQTAYDEAIFVLDLAHMPAGCSTWPAFWTLSKQGPWPAGGEIDIIEGTRPHVSHSFKSTHARTSSSYRCQFEHAKPSDFAHFSGLYDALHWTASDGVGLIFMCTLGS
jgi:hypothetical protein